MRKKYGLLAYPTINRPGGGKVIGLSTGKRGTFFEKVWNNAVSKVNNFAAVFLSWRADPSRDDEWYENTKKNLPNTWRQEYPSTPEEAFAIGQGAFFPEWNPEVHVIKDPNWYPPDECQIWERMMPVLVLELVLNGMRYFLAEELFVTENIILTK